MPQPPGPPQPILPPRPPQTRPTQEVTAKLDKKSKTSVIAKIAKIISTDNASSNPARVPNEGRTRQNPEEGDFQCSWIPSETQPVEDTLSCLALRHINEPSSNDNNGIAENRGNSHQKSKINPISQLGNLLARAPNSNRPLPPLPTTDTTSSSSLPQQLSSKQPNLPAQFQDKFSRPLPHVPTVAQQTSHSAPTQQFSSELNPLSVPSQVSHKLSRPLPTLPNNSQPSNPTTQPVVTPPPNYPPPVFIAAPVVSTAGDSSDTASSGGDTDGDFSSSGEDDYYENNEEYYSILGIDVKESERIYMSSRPTTLQQHQPDTSSLDTDISQFLTNEYKYLITIRHINDARKILNPTLQGLLQGVNNLVEVHNDMYAELYAGYQSCSKIAEVFLSRRDMLTPYVYYLMNAPMIEKHLKELPAGVMAQYPSIQIDIMTSWKRLNFYFLSLENMLKKAPAEDAEALQRAVDMFQEMNRKGDSGIMMDAVKGAPFSIHPLAPLLLHSILKTSSRGVGKVDYRVLLFGEMLILTLPKKDHYEFYDHLPINQLQLESGDSDTQFTLDKVRGSLKKSKRYTFRAPTAAVKDLWVSRIYDLLKDYADKIKQLTSLRYGVD